MAAILKLYTSHECVYCHRVHIVLDLLCIPFEEEIIDLSVKRSDGYLNINPGGLVPSLCYNGQIITESANIVQFLIEAYPSHLMPAERNSEVAFLNTRIRSFVDIYFEKVFPHSKKAIQLGKGKEADEAATEFVKQVCEEVEPLLADADPYFGGSKTLTRAEVLIAPFLLRILALPRRDVVTKNLIMDLPTKTPNFDKWASKVIEHPSVTCVWDEDKVVAGNENRLRTQSSGGGA